MYIWTIYLLIDKNDNKHENSRNYNYQPFKKYSLKEGSTRS